MQDYANTIKVFIGNYQNQAVNFGLEEKEAITILADHFKENNVTRVEVFTPTGHPANDWNVNNLNISFDEEYVYISYETLGKNIVNPSYFDESFWVNDFEEVLKKARNS